ncbi:LysM domain-containing protein [Klenkia sp. PcliD-1-E]|uniref:LysM peptidoglycan-binding domain-containing protein n=1 Tax=Klenkia sp. PcliD-1-E TaxID=2954492 RepID=UPI0020984897|nr:LysM domain-containing protein [Klenkia sp. PcliD-1-E]MCO7220367.1 LysM peptidoglycan-binding domain-containing protein [Klenkia sp. PcliD-1-E]
MSVQRWATSTLVVLLAGAGLHALAPDPAAWSALLADPQRVVDTAGPDALLVPVAWALAAACWAWGALGLLLTVASCGPRPLARVAVPLLHLVLPAALRRAAAVAVGLSLATAPVVVLTPGPPLAVAAAHQVAPGTEDTATATDGALPPVPDWPAPVPDWPAPAPADAHVVVRGDCLWDIAAGRLAEHGAEPDDVAVAAAVQAWWRANAAVIGPDPDLLLPGQVLRAP